MPIALDPNQTYPVYLTTDADVPETARPAFLFRYLTAREAVRVDGERKEISNQADAAKTQAETDALLDRAYASIKPLIAGGRNLPQGCTVESLTWDEFWDLFWSCRTAQRITEIDRKKSASAARSAGANSAPTATADATTPPAETTPTAASPAGDAIVPIPNAPNAVVSATTI